MQKKFLFIFLITLILYACSTTPVSNRSTLILIPKAQEISLGKQSYNQILEKEKESEDTQLNEVVRRVGQRIIAVSHMPKLDWEIKLIESAEKNAFALPGGKIAIYTGILTVAKNEAGLATVMSHEIAHVIARHGAQRMTQQMLLQIKHTRYNLILRRNYTFIRLEKRNNLLNDIFLGSGIFH